MGRVKRTSPITDKAEMRLQGLKSINPALDLGNGLSITAYEAIVDEAQGKQDAYNQLLSTVDEKLIGLKEVEKRLADFTERMLAGVAAKYGKDSAEYAQAGGTRKSEIKRSSGRATTKKNKSEPSQ